MNKRRQRVATLEGVKVAARNILVEPRSAGNEKTWNTLVAKFPPDDHAAVSTAAAAAAVAAVLARRTEVEDGNAPLWRLVDKYASEVISGVINSRSALATPRNDGQRFAHLQLIIQADISREEFGSGMTAFWRKLVDKPDAFPPEFWQLFMRSSLTALGGKFRPVCVGMTWRSLIIAGASSPLGLCDCGDRGLEEVNRR